MNTEIIVQNLYLYINQQKDYIIPHDTRYCNLKTLPINKGKVGSVSEIVYGEFKSLTLKESFNIDLLTYISDTPTGVDSLCTDYSKEKEELYSIKTDEYTNETLIACLLHYMFETYYKEYPKLYLIHYGASICPVNKKGETGTNLMEYTKYGNLDTFPFITDINNNYLFMDTYATTNKGRITYYSAIRLDTIVSILKQVTVGLKMLIDLFDFRSGDLKAANILVSNNTVKSNIYGVSIDSDFTCKIGDYGKSSITINIASNEFRIYNYNRYAEYYYGFVSLFDDNEANNDTYRIGSRLETVSRSRHLTQPYYQSFDFYTFLVSLLSVKEYSDTFFSNQILVDMWNTLFFDPAGVKSKLENKGRSINDTINILSDTDLKCDAIDLALTQLRKL